LKKENLLGHAGRGANRAGGKKKDPPGEKHSLPEHVFLKTRGVRE